MSDRLRGRDEFPARIKKFVADEVGYVCSNPCCRAPTIGPGNPGKISNVGVAAHITAASRLGPRHDDSLTSEQRRSAENAIHLCQTCGKHVDDGTWVHPATLLRQWKVDAIDLRRRALACGDIDPDGTIKLDRQCRHEVSAMTAYGLALRLQHTLIMGHATWRVCRREFESRAFVVRANADAWRVEHQQRHADVALALQRIRAQWGHVSPCEGAAGTAMLLNESGHWRDRFDMYLAQLFGCEEYLPFGVTIYADCEDIVNERLISEQQQVIGSAIERLDAWAAKHVATRRVALAHAVRALD